MARNNNTGVKTTLGLAAAAATAAGLYYFYGSSKAKQHRKQLKGWTVRARGEVMERLEKMSDVSQAAYRQAVKQVLGRYKTMKNVSTGELAELGRELYGHWNAIARDVKKHQTNLKRKSKASVK